MEFNWRIIKSVQATILCMQNQRFYFLITKEKSSQGFGIYHLKCISNFKVSLGQWWAMRWTLPGQQENNFMKCWKFTGT